MIIETKITLLILFVGTANYLFAQTPDTLWTRTYGGAGHDLGYAVRTCPDRGFIICGATASSGSGGWDVYLVRTDDRGDTLWTRTYGGPDNDEGRDIALTPDSGFIAVGYTCSFGAGGRDVYVIRVNAGGDTLWTRTYGGSSDDEANAVQPTPDKGFVIVGTTSSFGAGFGDLYLLKMDSLSDTLWSRTHGGASNETGADAVVLEDSFMVLCGSTWTWGAGAEDFYLVKTDPKGDTVWTRTHGGNDVDEAYDIAATADGGLLVSGTCHSSLLNNELFVFKTDADGQVRWNYFNGSLGDDTAYAVAEIPGRGYLIGGNFSYELFLIRTDTAGVHYQYWIFGGAGADCGRDIAVLPDTSFVLLANTTSFGSGQTDIWLLRFARDTLAVRESASFQERSPLIKVSPNPFRHAVWISAGIRKQGLGISIYDISGRPVKTMIVNSSLNPNSQLLMWDGMDQAGRPLPAGVYFVRLVSGGQAATDKVIKFE